MCVDQRERESKQTKELRLLLLLFVAVVPPQHRRKAPTSLSRALEKSPPLNVQFELSSALLFVLRAPEIPLRFASYRHLSLRLDIRLAPRSCSCSLLLLLVCAGKGEEQEKGVGTTASKGER